MVLLHPQRVLGVAAAEAEGQLHAGHVAGPVGKRQLEDVAASLGDGVDLLQTHPELSWTSEEAKGESPSCQCELSLTSGSHKVFTVQAAKADLVGLPQLVEVHRAVLAPLNHRPTAVCAEETIEEGSLA